MRRTLVTLGWLLALATLIGGGYAWWRYRQQHPVIQQVPRKGGLDVTLWALADLHFGSKVLGRNAKGPFAWVDALPVRKEMERQMHGIAGQPWPQKIGGTVDQASALLIAGDLTQDGKQSEWNQFVSFYGLHRSPPPPVPVYECVGNHDKHEGD